MKRDIDIEQYISYRFKGEAPKSKYQYETQHKKEFYSNWVASSYTYDPLRDELWYFYFSKFFAEIRPSQTDPFMDYQLHQCRDKRDFLAFVTASTNYLYPSVIQRGYGPEILQMWKEKASEWVAVKKKLLEYMPDRKKEEVPRIKAMRSGEAVTIWEVENFFKDRWGKPKRFGDKTHILEEGQVEDFVHAYFHGSEHPVEKKKIKSNGTQKDILMAVYEFFLTIDTDTSGTREYCCMLIDAFEEFEDYFNPKKEEYMVDELGKNFARYKKEIKEKMKV